ncbi:hypothetical protein [uncultured Deinococcus sp.]|uniref:hypothetical protein n=1 Tax=uncultured Deinococcus sp. TaxID=158789 RepID=UPI0025907F90|nr:hypothetical protein [uncultured Deinococcus sp.]
MSDVDNGEFRKELQELRDTVNGVRGSIETEFAVIKKEIQYMNKTNMPTLIVAMVALVLSICSGFVALDNKNLILTVNAQTNKNTRDLENMIPLVFSTPGPTPTPATSGKE